MKNIEELNKLLKEKFPKSKETREYWKREYARLIWELHYIELVLGTKKLSKPEWRNKYVLKSERGKKDESK